MNLPAIQQALRDEGIDGWLLYDAHGLNPIASQVAGVRGVVTRRWFILIPAQGEIHLVYHRIEDISFRAFSGSRHIYRTWQELDEGLRSILTGCRRIAMEYSPDNAIPYIARVDAGTIDKIRRHGVEVLSSADLVSRFLAVWTPDQIESHRRAARALLEIKDQAFAFVAERVRKGITLGEIDVVTFVRDEFTRRGLTSEGEGPICAVDGNAGNPHYEAVEGNSAAIKAGQLVLLDLWAKDQDPDAVYADITWTGYTGDHVPAEITRVFEIVARARDRGVAFANERFEKNEKVHGYEIDEQVRQVIADAGFGDQFTHRTGHSLGRSVHDVGPNIDSLETQDRRRLSEGLAFTIEPGIYLPSFGIRSEINVLIHKGRAEVTTLPLQTEVTPII